MDKDKKVKVLSFSNRNIQEIENKLNKLVPPYRIKKIMSHSYQSGSGKVAVMKSKIIVFLVHEMYA